jgi:hypothetical protein
MTDERYRQLVAGRADALSPAEWADDRVRRLGAISALSADLGRKLIGLDDDGQPIDQRDQRHAARWCEANDAIKELEDGEVLSMGVAFFPHFADTFARAWSLLAELPTRARSDGLWFRAPGRPDLLLPARRSFLDLLLRALRGVDQSLPWVAANFQANGRDRGLSELGVLLAAAIDAGGEQGEAVRLALQGAEHEGHVTAAMLCCGRPDCWSLVIDRLDSPECPEWLREEIARGLHFARPEAFAAVVRAVAERDLLRFPEVAEAARSWHGMPTDADEGPALATWADLIGEDSSRRSVIARGDARLAYAAARAAALDDVSVALGAVDAIAASPVVQKRFVAVHVLGELAIADCLPRLGRALDDPDPRVAVYAATQVDRLMRNLADYVTVEAGGTSEWGPRPPSDLPGAAELLPRMSALSERLPTEPSPLPQFDWPELESELVVSRRTVADAMPLAIGGRRPAVLGPYLDTMSVGGRRAVANIIGRFGDGEGEERVMLLSLLSDADEDVQAAAAKALRMRGVRAGDLPALEELLSRDSSGLRLAVAELIATLPDADALNAAERVLNSPDVLRRHGGLEVLSSLKRAGRWPRAAGAIVDAFTPRDRDERVYKSNLTSEERPPTLDDGLGLIDLTQLTRRQPTRRGVVHCGAAAAELLRSLDDLVESLRDRHVAPRAYRGYPATLPLGELDHHWPSALLNRHTYPKDEAGRPARDVLPLHEVWFDWWRNRSARDDDNLEGVRAVHAASVSSLGRHRESWMGDVFAELMSEAPALRHPRACREILQWILVHDAPAGIGQFAVETYEDALARVPSGAGKHDLKLFVSDWSTESLVQLARDAGDWSIECERRRWAMASWADPTMPGVDEERRMLQGVLLPAFDAGVATEADLLWALVGQRENRPFDKAFRELREASSLLRQGVLTQRAAAVVRRAIDRVVEIELRRGEERTEASLPALYLRNAGGGETLLQLLEALPGEPLRDCTDPSSATPTDVSRPGVWSWLIQSTWPTAEDTPAGFAAAAKSAQVSEETLLRTVVFAPQWAEHVETALGWPGLADAVWWLRAHTRRGIWIVNPDKRQVWEAAIRARTPSAPEQLSDGAIDEDWFARVIGSLGEARWRRVASAAKFASADDAYRRAVLSADGLLGRLTR